METHTEPKAADPGLDMWLAPHQPAVQLPADSAEGGFAGTRRPRLIAAAVESERFVLTTHLSSTAPHTNSVTP